jgi:TRAP-type C4-dicarboxylate transport system permease small subunit
VTEGPTEHRVLEEGEPGPRHPALHALAVVENALITLLLAAIVLTVLAQVAFRYVVDQPLSWSTEVATDLLVYVAFVGFAIGIRDNAHVAMRLFENRLGATPRRWLRVVELVVLGVVVACIGIGGAVYGYEQRDVLSPSDIPLWATFAALPLGATLGVVHIVVEVVALLRGADAPGLVPPPDDTEPVSNDGASPPPAVPGSAA